MKKIRTMVKSEPARRSRRRPSASPAGMAPESPAGPAEGPESPLFWQQLKSVGGEATLRYRRD